MDKKILELNLLKEKINITKEKIKNLNENLKELEKEYTEKKKSARPILMFILDESAPKPNDEKDYLYEYIYYYPELDEIVYIKDQKDNNILPNAIDLREIFIDLDIPNYIWPYHANDYFNEILIAKNYLKIKIDEIINQKKMQ